MQDLRFTINGWIIIIRPVPDHENRLYIDCYRVPSATSELIRHPLLRDGERRVVDGNEFAGLCQSCLQWKPLSDGQTGSRQPSANWTI